MTVSLHRRWLSVATAAAFSMGVVNLVLAEDKAPEGKEKPAQSTLKIGEKAPSFVLKDTDGKEHNLADYTAQGKIVVLEWFNSGCPFIKLHHEKQSTFADLSKEFSEKNVVFIAINSTNTGHADFGKDAQAKTDWKIEFPILVDADGKVGQAYGAKTTPHMFVIDKNGVLAYSGAIDNDPRNEKSADDQSADGKVNYVRTALNELVEGKPVTTAETKPYGCGVKY